jgi:sucrose phosphorylase
VARFLDVLRFRNTFPAFDGDLTVEETPTEGELALTWSTAGAATTLRADLRTKAYGITAAEAGGAERMVFSS